jgi:hypothetical protein
MVGGADPALEALETSFQQDLNGDGTIGLPPPIAIETLGQQLRDAAGSRRAERAAVPGHARYDR